MSESGSEAASDGGPLGPQELRRIPLLASLSDAQLAEVFAALEIRRIRARTPLNYDDCIKGRVVFIWASQVRVIAFTPAGGHLTVGEVGEGAVFGLAFAALGLRPADPLRIIADRGATLLFAPADLIISLGRGNQVFSETLIEYFARAAAHSTSRMYEMTALDVRTRLKAELLRLCDGAGEARSWTIRPAPTHAILGSRIGVTREAVTRHLKELEQEGLIVFKRNHLEVRQLDLLRRATLPAGQHLFKPQSPNGN